MHAAYWAAAAREPARPGGGCHCDGGRGPAPAAGESARFSGFELREPAVASLNPKRALPNCWRSAARATSCPLIRKLPAWRWC